MIRLTPVRLRAVAVEVIAAVIAAAVGADAMPAVGAGMVASTEACTKVVSGVITAEPAGAFNVPTSMLPELMSTPPEKHSICCPPFGFCDAVNVKLPSVVVVTAGPVHVRSSETFNVTVPPAK